eukprot:8772431-Pyramimonas_sp.AAC.1
MARAASLALLLFNPLTAKPDRQRGIFEEAANFGLIALTGAQRLRREPHPEQIRVNDARVIDA